MQPTQAASTHQMRNDVKNILSSNGFNTLSPNKDTDSFDSLYSLPPSNDDNVYEMPPSGPPPIPAQAPVTKVWSACFSRSKLPFSQSNRTRLTTFLVRVHFNRLCSRRPNLTLVLIYSVCKRLQCKQHRCKQLECDQLQLFLSIQILSNRSRPLAPCQWMPHFTRQWEHQLVNR